MDREDIDTDQARPRWFIELDWFQPNNRSFFTLARRLSFASSPANGNQPLDLEELGQQLGTRRSGDASHTSIEVLPRLLKSDQHYGLRQAGE